MTLPRWRGRRERREQVANACDDFPTLTPASAAAATTTTANWSTLLTGQTVPLIGEDRRNDVEEDQDFC